MESDRRRRIRRISIPLFWIIEIYLLIVLLVGLYVKYYEEKLPEAIVEAQAIENVVMADGVWFASCVQVNMQREADIALYTPPADGTTLSEWATQIKTRMSVDCAVFFYDGKALHWPILPAQFEERARAVDTLVRQPFVKGEGRFEKEIGKFKLEGFSGRSGLTVSSEPRVIVIEPPDSDLRWGVVYNFHDAFLAFSEFLNASRDTLPRNFSLGAMSHVFDIKRHVKTPDTVSARGLYGLQIFSKSDSLLYSTPGIDTSYHKIEQSDSLLPFRSIVYNTRSSEDFLRSVKEKYSDDFSIPWFKIFTIMFEMFVLALFYQWIDKLTRE